PSARGHGEVARPRVGLDALDLDAEMDEAALGGAQRELGRLDRDGDVRCWSALDDLARAVADHLLVAHDVEPDVAAWSEARLQRRPRRAERGGEAPFHVRRAPPVEPSVDDRAA